MRDDRDELTALRARAYGADADIAADPDALRRLAVLEEASRRARTAPPPPPIAPRVPEPVAPALAAELGPGAEAGDADPADSFAPTVPTVRRWTTAQALAAVLAAVLVTAGLAVPATLLLAPAGPRPIAVLHIDPDADVPPAAADVAGEQAVRYDDYLGMQLTSGGSDRAEGLCLTVLITTDGTSGSATGTGTCAATGLEPWLDLTVDARVGAQVRARHPEGSTLRFALVGDEVHVFASDPPAA